MEIAIILGLIDLAIKSIPLLERRLKDGDITPEEQQQAKDALEALRLAINSGKAFSGPEWEA